MPLKHRNLKRRDGKLITGTPTPTDPIGTQIGTRNRLVPIAFDQSNNACYITIAWISYFRDNGHIEKRLWDICFPNINAALFYFKPQIRGEWKLAEGGGYEADLRLDCAMNTKGDPVKAYYIKIGTLLLSLEEASIDDLVSEDR